MSLYFLYASTNSSYNENKNMSSSLAFHILAFLNMDDITGILEPTQDLDREVLRPLACRSCGPVCKIKT